MATKTLKTRTTGHARGSIPDKALEFGLTSEHPPVVETAADVNGGGVGEIGGVASAASVGAIGSADVADLLYLPPSALTPWKDNPRQNDGEPVAKVAQSIQRFGFGAPIVARAANREIIAGHTRWKAAIKLRLERVPVRLLDIDEHNAHLLALADNRLTELTAWSDSLADVLKTFAVDERDVAGWTAKDVEELERKMRGGAGELQEDEVPEPPANPITKPGDVWTLGRHRLVCGDCTKTTVVAQATNGLVPAVVLTDPPYGINQPGVPNDTPGELLELVRGAVAALPIRDGIVIAFQSTRTFPAWLDAIRAADHQFERMLWMYKEAQCTFPWRGWILTSEAIIVSTVGNPVWHEEKPYAHDCYKLSEVSHELPDEIGWHGSVKPQVVLVDLLRRTSATGDVVFDGFCGSGSTLIAAEQIGRVCVAIELSPAYCDVIVQRWENLTSGKATRTQAG